MKTSFIKQSIGINPLLTARDWLLLFGLIGALGLAWRLVPGGGANAFARGAFVGGICGSLPGLIGCLPVRGSVAAERRLSFLGRIEQFGYRPAGDVGEEQVYNYKGARWMRWDSNRVVVRNAADGTLQVTAPYSFYFRLKRLQT